MMYPNNDRQGEDKTNSEPSNTSLAHAPGVAGRRSAHRSSHETSTTAGDRPNRNDQRLQAPMPCARLSFVGLMGMMQQQTARVSKNNGGTGSRRNASRPNCHRQQEEQPCVSSARKEANGNNKCTVPRYLYDPLNNAMTTEEILDKALELCSISDDLLPRRLLADRNETNYFASTAPKGTHISIDDLYEKMKQKKSRVVRSRLCQDHDDDNNNSGGDDDHHDLC